MGRKISFIRSITVLNGCVAGSLGVDCRNLGIPLSNTTSPAPPPSLSDNGSSFAGGKRNFAIKLILFNSLVTSIAF